MGHVTYTEEENDKDNNNDNDDTSMLIQYLTGKLHEDNEIVCVMLCMMA